LREPDVRRRKVGKKAEERAKSGVILMVQGEKFSPFGMKYDAE